MADRTFLMEGEFEGRQRFDTMSSIQAMRPGGREEERNRVEE